MLGLKNAQPWVSCICPVRFGSVLFCSCKNGSSILLCVCATAFGPVTLVQNALWALSLSCAHARACVRVCVRVCACVWERERESVCAGFRQGWIVHAAADAAVTTSESFGMQKIQTLVQFETKKRPRVVTRLLKNSLRSSHDYGHPYPLSRRTLFYGFWLLICIQPDWMFSRGARGKSTLMLLVHSKCVGSISAGHVKAITSN